MLLLYPFTLLDIMITRIVVAVLLIAAVAA